MHVPNHPTVFVTMSQVRIIEGWICVYLQVDITTIVVEHIHCDVVIMFSVMFSFCLIYERCRYSFGLVMNSTGGGCTSKDIWYGYRISRKYNNYNNEWGEPKR